jgi:hypothetical protein
MFCARRSRKTLDDRRFLRLDHEEIDDPANDRASSRESEGDPAVDLSRPEELGGNGDLFARRRVFPTRLHRGFVGIGRQRLEPQAVPAFRSLPMELPSRGRP